MKTKKPTLMYSSEDLDRALEALQKGQSLRKVAQQFGIPKSTLYTKNAGLVPRHCRKGPATILTTAEEKRIKNWIMARAKVGYPTHAKEIKDAVQRMLEKSKRETIFKNNRPSDNWFNRFLLRHPEVKTRNAEVTSKCRASITEPVIRKWHQDCKVFLDENKLGNVLNRSTSIFNGEQIDVKVPTKTEKQLEVEKGQENYKIDDEKATDTVFCTFSAAGDILPPMILYPYKRIPSFLTDSVPTDMAMGKSDNGSMTSEAFFQYITKVFYPWCLQNNVEFPVMFFVDGHKSLINLLLNEFCIEHKIIIYPLFPNANNIIQPSDVAIFKELKEKWRNVLREYKSTTQHLLRRDDFASLFKKALNQISNTSIISAFKKCGLCPWDENAIDYSRCISISELENQLHVENEEMEVSNLTVEDIISTKKFFQQYIPKSTLEYYNNLLKQNESVEDSLFNLWKTCNDLINKNLDVPSIPENENSVMDTM